MRQSLRKSILLIIIAVIVLTLSACTDKKTAQANNATTLDTETRELRQNDYRGGVKRTHAIQQGVLNVMESMKANNITIRSDNPNSFWTKEGYQDFVSTFLDIPIINDTQWFNEEETDWAAILAQMATVESSFTTATNNGYQLQSGITITRNEKDDYSITGVPDNTLVSLFGNGYNGRANYRILYDCDKDWCKAYATVQFASEIPKITTQLYEYQRVDENTFAIQTSRERLMVVFEPVEADTDIRERTIKEFYYSKLIIDGQRTTFKPYEPLPETYSSTNIVATENIRKNEYMKKYPQINEYGDLMTRYGENDSMFFYSLKDIGRDWVFEDGSLQQAIVYKDGILIVTTFNKLSQQYERFIFVKPEANQQEIPELENIVVINGLVGGKNVETSIIQPPQEPTPTPAASPDTTSETEQEEIQDTNTEQPSESPAPAEDENQKGGE